MSLRSFLADKPQTIGSSGIRRVFDLAATMENPVDLSIGQPDFAVPDPIKQAAINAILTDHNNYTVTYGLPELRNAIATALKNELKWTADVLVTSGVSGGLVLALMACLNPGDEVIFADPYFVSYRHLVNLFGGTPKPVSIYPDFRLSARAFAEASTTRTKIILLNSPANPTGVVHSADEIRSLCELARERDWLIISDEIYNLLSYDGPVASPVSFAPERTLLLRGFGKSYAMTGWRMGYAAGPESIIREMGKLQQFTFVCAPHPAQVACLTALQTDMSSHVDDYRRKRDLAVASMQKAFDFPRPGGGFYLFPGIPNGYASAGEFVEQAIKNRCLVIPGNVFSEEDTHFRVSYAVPNERLIEGCDILCRLAK